MDGKRLVKTIKRSTRMTIEEYCNEKLDTTYKSFSYRVRKKALRYDEYLQIMKDCRMTWEQLFMKPVEDKPTSEDKQIPQERSNPLKGINAPVEILPGSIHLDGSGNKVEEEVEFIDTFGPYKKR